MITDMPYIKTAGCDRPKSTPQDGDMKKKHLKIKGFMFALSLSRRVVRGASAFGQQRTLGSRASKEHQRPCRKRCGDLSSGQPPDSALLEGLAACFSSGTAAPAAENLFGEAPVPTAATPANAASSAGGARCWRSQCLKGMVLMFGSDIRDYS